MDLSWLNDLPTRLAEHELSRNGRHGLAVARILDRHYPDHHGDGIEQEAREYDVTPSTIRRWIHTARHELQRPPRTCELCDQPLPLGARTSRRYCNQHNTILARVHRHRAHQRTTNPATNRPTGPQPPPTPSTPSRQPSPTPPDRGKRSSPQPRPRHHHLEPQRRVLELLPPTKTRRPNSPACCRSQAKAGTATTRAWIVGIS